MPGSGARLRTNAVRSWILAAVETMLAVRGFERADNCRGNCFAL